MIYYQYLHNEKYPLILKTISITIFSLSMLLVANIGKAQNSNFRVALPEDITICDESEINVVAAITGNYKDFNWSADTGDNLPYLLDFFMAVVIILAAAE